MDTVVGLWQEKKGMLIVDNMCAMFPVCVIYLYIFSISMTSQLFCCIEW